jgi:hypothetical protein
MTRRSLRRPLVSRPAVSRYFQRPPHQGSDCRPRTRAQNCRCYRAGRAPRRSNGNGRRTAALSSCRSRRRRPVVRRARSIPSVKVHTCAYANLLHCWHAFVVDRPGPRHIAVVSARSKALLAIPEIPPAEVGNREAHKGAPARPVAETPRARQADVICRGAKGAKRSGFARRRSSRRSRTMRRAAPVWRTARENQKARAAGAGGRSTSNRISPSRRSY